MSFNTATQITKDEEQCLGMLSELKDKASHIFDNLSNIAKNF